MSSTQNSRIAERLAARIIDATHPRRSDQVVVLGNHRVDLLLAFAHQGFARVACRSAEGVQSAAEPPVNLAVAPAVHSEGELRAVLSQLGRELGAGGTLVIATDDESAEWMLRLREILVRIGFAFIRTQLEPEGGLLVFCRKEPPCAQAA